MDHLTYENKENVEELEGPGPGQAHGNLAWSGGLLGSAAVLMPQLYTLFIHSSPVPRACSLAGWGGGGASKPGLQSVPSGPLHHTMTKEALQIHAYECSRRVIGEKFANRLSETSATAKAMSLGVGWASQVTSALQHLGCHPRT